MHFRYLLPSFLLIFFFAMVSEQGNVIGIKELWVKNHSYCLFKRTTHL